VADRQEWWRVEDHAGRQSDLIVVTGGGTGLGRAVAVAALASGSSVLVVGRRVEKLDGLLTAHPEAALHACVADVATVEGVVRVQKAVRELDQPIAAVVAAAGAAARRPDEGADLGEVQATWLQAWHSNVLSSVLTVEGLLAQAAPDVRVVLIGSIAVLRGGAGPYSSGPYAATKAALTGYMHDLARRLGTRGGTANVVAPGFVPDTDLWGDRLTAEAVGLRTAETLLGRVGTPEDVAAMVTFLLGSGGAWVTGQVLSPNGGAVLGR
jgi:3-oxoacyl-[acyl-carrier protein] reductase